MKKLIFSSFIFNLTHGATILSFLLLNCAPGPKISPFRFVPQCELTNHIPKKFTPTQFTIVVNDVIDNLPVTDGNSPSQWVKKAILSNLEQSRLFSDVLDKGTADFILITKIERFDLSVKQVPQEAKILTTLGSAAFVFGAAISLMLRDAKEPKGPIPSIFWKAFKDQKKAAKIALISSFPIFICGHIIAVIKPSDATVSCSLEFSLLDGKDYMELWRRSFSEFSTGGGFSGMNRKEGVIKSPLPCKAFEKVTDDLIGELSIFLNNYKSGTTSK